MSECLVIFLSYHAIIVECVTLINDFNSFDRFCFLPRINRFTKGSIGIGLSLRIRFCLQIFEPMTFLSGQPNKLRGESLNYDMLICCMARDSNIKT